MYYTKDGKVLFNSKQLEFEVSNIKCEAMDKILVLYEQLNKSRMGTFEYLEIKIEIETEVKHACKQIEKVENLYK